jgi:hypothetical protein
MKTKKRFNCVEMKWAIQQALVEEFAGLSDEEAHKKQMSRVMQHPTLGPFYKNVRSAQEPAKK